MCARTVKLQTNRNDYTNKTARVGSAVAPPPPHVAPHRFVRRLFTGVCIVSPSTKIGSPHNGARARHCAITITNWRSPFKAEREQNPRKVVSSEVRFGVIL
ncbi:hypothetical protein EVAR_11821_1 [Eumeta japonica]|uniref:Uncharacterized protein n=1 Tax=Eumeta variegata TaxID=151549 RepID=A0A4C1UPJ4_EUMVA|nr:hypothetical protein EVAR_11821_1 [Eumeta japonica]